MNDPLAFLNFLMAGMLLFAGGYAIYSAIRLKVQYYLFENRYLYPGNCEPKDCKDAYGFIDYIFPTILTLGIICFLLGLLYASTRFTSLISLPTWVVDYLIPAVGFLAFVWYVIVQRKAAKKFW